MFSSLFFPSNNFSEGISPTPFLPSYAAALQLQRPPLDKGISIHLAKVSLHSTEASTHTCTNKLTGADLINHFLVPSPQQALLVDFRADVAGQHKLGVIKSMKRRFPDRMACSIQFREGFSGTQQFPVWRPWHQHKSLLD